MVVHGAGGSLESRERFLLEFVGALIAAVGAERVDVRECTLHRYREGPCFDADLQFRCGGVEQGESPCAWPADSVQAPAEPLEAGDGRWPPAEELSRRCYWERLVFPLRP
ncbi:hypothetical protein D9M71_498560 [compost metagenome]